MGENLSVFNQSWPWIWICCCLNITDLVANISRRPQLQQIDRHCTNKHMQRSSSPSVRNVTGGGGRQRPGALLLTISKVCEVSFLHQRSRHPFVCVCDLIHITPQPALLKPDTGITTALARHHSVNIYYALSRFIVSAVPYVKIDSYFLLFFSGSGNRFSIFVAADDSAL